MTEFMHLKTSKECVCNKAITRHKQVFPGCIDLPHLPVTALQAVVARNATLLVSRPSIYTVA